MWTTQLDLHSAQHICHVLLSLRSSIIYIFCAVGRKSIFNSSFLSKECSQRCVLQLWWWIHNFPKCNTIQGSENQSQWPTCHSPIVTNKSSILILRFCSSQPDWEMTWQQVSQPRKINILREHITLLHLEPVSYLMEETVHCAIYLTWLLEEFARRQWEFKHLKVKV